MKTTDWLSIVDKINEINCAYGALVSLLAWNAKELTENERCGVHIINDAIFGALKSAIEDICRLGKISKSCAAPE